MKRTYIRLNKKSKETPARRMAYIKTRAYDIKERILGCLNL